MWSNNNYVNFCQQQTLNDAIKYVTILPVAFNLSAPVLHNPTQSSSENLSACTDVWFSMMWCVVQGGTGSSSLTDTNKSLICFLIRCVASVLIIYRG